MFDQLGIKVENLNNHPELPEVEETGMTFEENARLKAETISELTGKMVLSDDSGLQVDVLGGFTRSFGLRALLVLMLRMLKIMLNYCTSWLWCLMIANVLRTSIQP